MKTQGVVLSISPEGRIVRQNSNGKTLPIQYTDTSNQHISKVGDIPILYANTLYQHISKVGDIPILYVNTLYQHVRQVGNITIHRKHHNPI